MKISAHVLNKFAQTPWSITSEAAISWATTCSYEAVPSVCADGVNFLGDSLPTVSIISGVAIVPICCAALIHGASAIEKGFGAQSHSDISEMLEDAEANPNLAGILLNVSCAGGTVVGTPELAAQIAALTKPCVAYSDSLCCSSAYWLANAASGGFYVTSCAMTGSVGCIAQVQNIAGLLASSGIEVSTFTSGSLKAAGNPFKSMNDAERGHFQGLVTLMGLKFKSAIRAKRPSVADSDLEGQSFLGSDAVEHGLADGVVSGQAEVLRKFRQPSGENQKLSASASSIEQEWRSNASVRKEFRGSFAAFKALRHAEAHGKAVVFGRGETPPPMHGRIRHAHPTAAPKLSPSIPAPTPVPAPVATADYKKQFESSAELKAEFTTLAIYTAFMEASRRGQIKLKQ